MAPLPTPINGIDHIGLLVRDIDAALPYFTDRLGFTLISDEFTPASGGARLAYLDAGNVVLQLVSPTGANGPIAEHLETHGEGLHHICLAVDDIDRTIADLTPAADVAVSLGGRGRKVAFLPARPHGLIMELTERVNDRKTTTDRLGTAT
jgi:methylmalonyl-CoA/ethylmalonyl-CoA epimerase